MDYTTHLVPGSGQHPTSAIRPAPNLFDNQPQASYHSGSFEAPYVHPLHSHNDLNHPDVATASYPHPPEPSLIYPSTPWYIYPQATPPHVSKLDHSPQASCVIEADWCHPDGVHEAADADSFILQSSTLQPLRRVISTAAVLHASERRRLNPHKFFCEYCSRGFTAKHNYRRHVAAHNDDRPFLCDCGASFITKQDLKRHQGRSSRCRPSQCTDPCGSPYPAVQYNGLGLLY